MTCIPKRNITLNKFSKAEIWYTICMLVLVVVSLAIIGTSQTKAQRDQAQLAKKPLTVVATAHSVTLSWTASTQPPTVQGYNVYKASTSGGEVYTSPLNSVLITATNTVDTQVSSLQTYYYTVEASCTTCSPTNSVPSNEVKATIPGDPQPNPPTNVTATEQ